jgi:alkylated DNA repair protein (DNA oxidative demethylase)
MIMSDLFASDLFETPPEDIVLDPGAMLLADFARAEAKSLLQDVAAIARAAPFRHLVTPGGWTMSVAMTNCGALGWVSDRSGYRYDRLDPESGQPWPALPSSFLDLARRAAMRAGFADFTPDACLVNRYVPGARLTLHQDRNERRLEAPIVSVSLGLPATFLWGGLVRADKPRRLRLVHGDVVVWGGPARMTFHGVDTLRDGDHPMTGAVRYNLTFRQAGDRT